MEEQEKRETNLVRSCCENKINAKLDKTRLANVLFL